MRGENDTASFLLWCYKGIWMKPMTGMGLGQLCERDGHPAHTYMGRASLRVTQPRTMR